MLITVSYNIYFVNVPEDVGIKWAPIITRLGCRHVFAMFSSLGFALMVVGCATELHGSLWV